MNISKNELRKIVRQRKKDVPLDIKKLRSEKIWKRVELIPEFQQAKVILFYWSMDDEVFTHDEVIKQAKSRTILLPVVDGDILRIKQFCGVENLCEGDLFGIGEPTGDDYLDTDKIDLIVVPGVAFDPQCNRMGRGRGYYDKLLSTTKAFKLGVAFDFQIFENIPTENFDIKMDCVVAEKDQW